MDTFFEEVVDFLEENHKPALEIFQKHDTTVKTAGNCIRPVAIFLTMLGFYLLFSPIIAILSWIPLVGSLLGAVFAFAAAIFAFILGGTIACLVLGTAWLVFRPLYGTLLLVVTAIGFSLIFFIDTKKTEVVSGETVVVAAVAN